ncbi:MAG: MJ0042-type zinc finger domain-containing protein, partial [Burkholderiales bacterium]
MALATTCPQCKTSFKVVPDQLKLRRGLVRCGVCQHVFSGIDHLRYVDDAARAAQRAARERATSGAASPAGATGTTGIAGTSG